MSRRLRQEAEDALLELERSDRAAYEAVMQVVLLLADRPDKSRR